MKDIDKKIMSATEMVVNKVPLWILASVAVALVAAYVYLLTNAHTFTPLYN